MNRLIIVQEHVQDDKSLIREKVKDAYFQFF